MGFGNIKVMDNLEWFPWGSVSRREMEMSGRGRADVEKVKRGKCRVFFKEVLMRRRESLSGKRVQQSKKKFF